MLELGNSLYVIFRRMNKMFINYLIQNTQIIKSLLIKYFFKGYNDITIVENKKMSTTNYKINKNK